MASLTGGIELDLQIDGRDEDTVRRFFDKLQARLPELVAAEAKMHAGVDFGRADAVPARLVVRA